MIPGNPVQRVACILSVALVVLAALHLYWAFGGMRGLAAALGRQEVRASAGLRIGAGAVAVGLLTAAVVVLVRTGACGALVPWVLSSWGTWALVAAFFLAALLNVASRTRMEKLVFAPIAFALGVLALIVARSPRP